MEQLLQVCQSAEVGIHGGQQELVVVRLSSCGSDGLLHEVSQEANRGASQGNPGDLVEARVLLWEYRGVCLGCAFEIEPLAPLTRQPWSIRD